MILHPGLWCVYSYGGHLSKTKSHVLSLSDLLRNWSTKKPLTAEKRDNGIGSMIFRMDFSWAASHKRDHHHHHHHLPNNLWKIAAQKKTWSILRIQCNLCFLNVVVVTHRWGAQRWGLCTTGGIPWGIGGINLENGKGASSREFFPRMRTKASLNEPNPGKLHYIAMENGPFEDVFFLLNIDIFHCYVSLPESNISHLLDKKNHWLNLAFSGDMSVPRISYFL